jgi:predicted RNA-binding protein YlqC (UPF0109 family)
MEMFEELLELTRRVVRALVDHPDLVDVSVNEADRGVSLILIGTGPGELGQVIGRQGRNLDALRTVVQACAAKHHGQVEVDLLDPKGRLDDSDPMPLDHRRP